jgi:hypothetical protein
VPSTRRGATWQEVAAAIDSWLDGVLDTFERATEQAT